MSCGRAAVCIAEHVLFGERQCMNLLACGLPFQKVMAQQWKFLEWDLIFANQTKIDADGDFSSRSIGTNTFEYIRSYVVVLLVETR